MSENKPAEESLPIDNKTNGAGNPIAMLEAYMTPIFQCVVRGMLVSLSNVPPQVVICTVARTMGWLLGGALQGPLTDVLKMRKMIKDEFDNGMKAAKIMPVPMPQQPTQSAPFQPR